MQENWQAEINSDINSKAKWKKLFSRSKFTQINTIIVLLLIVFAIPAIIGGIFDQRSRASEEADNALKMNLNVPICSNHSNMACGYNTNCEKAQEGAICEQLAVCQNNNSTNNVFICKNSKWVYTTRINTGYCNLCAETKPTHYPLQPTLSVSPSPTIFQSKE